MSTVTETQKKERREALQRAQADEFAFDRRLLESALAFGNGDEARQCFEWVEAAIQERARAAGCVSTEIASLKWKADWTGVPAPELRWKFRVSLGRSSRLQRERPSPSERKALDDWFTEQLAGAQTVLKSRMLDGEVYEVPIARLDNVERCIAYTIRLYLLDAHGFRRAVKQCPFVPSVPTSAERPIENQQISVEKRLESAAIRGALQRVLNWHADQNIRQMPHWFLQLPVTKRLYCSDQHASADRQRRFRRKTVPRKPK
jgi:hypothetical protein